MAKPFIKYLGGKSNHAVTNLLPSLVPDNFHTYVEPFVGGGGIFFNLHSAGLLDDKLVVLGDADADLINLYAAVVGNPHRLVADAYRERDNIGALTNRSARKKGYNQLRELWNLGARRPAHQLYLRHASFNGMWRVSQKGWMNVPPRDGLDRIHLPSVPELLDCADVLNDVEFLDWDFRRYEDEDSSVFIGPGCLVPVDPPYDGDGGFREYTAARFHEKDQRELVQHCATWADRGAVVVYMNADTPLVNELLAEYWPEAHVQRIAAARSNAADGTKRQPAPEVIAYVQ